MPRRGKKTKIEGIPYEIRTVDKGLDEVVAGHFGIPVSEFTKRKRAKKQKGVTVHLERMSRGHWWLGIGFPGKRVLHINLTTKRPRRGGSEATIHARAELD
jgi:hypothetical protein